MFWNNKKDDGYDYDWALGRAKALASEKVDLHCQLSKLRTVVAFLINYEDRHLGKPSFSPEIHAKTQAFVRELVGVELEKVAKEFPLSAAERASRP